MRTLLGLGEVRIERRLSLQQDTSEAKQPVGDATQRAAMRFAAPAQHLDCNPRPRPASYNSADDRA